MVPRRTNNGMVHGIECVWVGPRDTCPDSWGPWTKGGCVHGSRGGVVHGTESRGTKSGGMYASGAMGSQSGVVHGTKDGAVHGLKSSVVHGTELWCPEDIVQEIMGSGVHATESWGVHRTKGHMRAVHASMAMVILSTH